MTAVSVNNQETKLRPLAPTGQHKGNKIRFQEKAYCVIEQEMSWKYKRNIDLLCNQWPKSSRNSQSSFRRKPESKKHRRRWTPAFAGETIKATPERWKASRQDLRRTWAFGQWSSPCEPNQSKILLPPKTRPRPGLKFSGKCLRKMPAEIFNVWYHILWYQWHCLFFRQHHHKIFRKTLQINPCGFRLTDCPNDG